jgi:putative ABC transport system permease protein
MRSIWQDVRFGFRMLVKSPGITLAAILAFGVGIGANTAIFSVSNVYLRAPIAFPDVDRIVMVLGRAPGQTEGWSEVSPADFQDFQARNQSLESLAAYEWASVNLTGVNEPVKVQGFRVSANFFDVLRAAPELGRGFVREEDQPGHDHVAVLSDGLWRRQFGSDPNILNRTIYIDGVPTQIVGVMKDKVRFPQGVDIWMPLAITTEASTVRDVRYLSPVARLKPGVTLEQARAEMNTLQEHLQKSFPKTEQGWGVQCMTLSDFVAGPGKGYAVMLLFSVGFLLLIACTNVTNLLLARSAARQNEFAIRASLGATRFQLLRQILMESMLLAMGGTVAGLLLGSWWISLIRGAMPPEVERYIPAWDRVRLDGRVFFYTFVAAMLAGLFAGLFPALFGSSTKLHDALKESGRGGGPSVAKMRLRSALIVVQVALSLVLLVGAALVTKGLRTLFALNFQSNPEEVLTFSVALPEYKYATPQQRAAFYDSLTERLNRASGVQGSVVATSLPFAGYFSDTFSIENRPSQPGEFLHADVNNIGPAYFRLLRLSMLEGRDFSDADSSDAPLVVIVSEKLAKRFWPEGGALGHRLKLGDESSKEGWATIVGVAPEITYDPWTHEPPPAIYVPFRQHPSSSANIAVRTDGDPRAFIPMIRAAVSGIDPDQPVFDVFSLYRVMSNQILGLSYVAVLMGVTGLMALGLSAVGVSGVMAYAVTQRVHEIGVRMALGAKPGDVLRLFLKHGLKLLLIGVCVGLPLSFALARLLSSLLFGVQSNDFTSFLVGALILGIVVFVACYIPARQATRVDPMVALRYE